MTEPLALPSLSELFARDPYTLTRDGPEITAMVTHLRAQRAQFKASEAAGERPKAGRKPKASPEEAKAALAQLDIDI